MTIHIDLEDMGSADLAELFDVTSQAIRKWARDGMPHWSDGKDLHFAWKPCRTWWATNKHRGSSVAVKASGVPTKATSEARLMDVKVRREEMRLAREEGRLVPAEEIEPAWMRVAETVKNRVMTLAPAAKEAIPHLTTEDVKTLHRLCREALEELSQCPTSKS
jgi:phage terminase Nu1 subunit (DNA packaging protein)